MLPGAQAAFAAGFLRGGYCQPAPESDYYNIAVEESILDKKSNNAGAQERANVKGREDEAAFWQPKFVCDAFQGEVTVRDIYARGWRVVGVWQSEGQSTRAYSAKRGLFSGEARHQERKGAKVNGLVIEEQPKRAK